MDESDREALRIVRGFLEVGGGRLYEHSSATFRWLMATLFASHGGAILGLLNAKLPWPSSVALLWFGVGLLLSILMGVSSTFLSVRQIFHIQKARTEIEIALLQGGGIPKGLVPKLEKGRPSWKTWTPTGIGVLSFIYLNAGMVTAARALVVLANC